MTNVHTIPTNDKCWECNACQNQTFFIITWPEESVECSDCGAFHKVTMTLPPESIAND